MIAPHPQRLTLAKVIERFQKDGATPLIKDYKNNFQQIPFICRCGKSSTTTLSAVNGPKAKTKVIKCRSCAYPTGQSSRQWDPSISPEERALRKERPLDARRWAVAIRMKFRNKCVISGKTTNTAHHLYNYSHYPELRLDLRNGVLLSKELHEEFHAKYGKGCNTLAQFSEFFKHKTGRSFPDPFEGTEFIPIGNSVVLRAINAEFVISVCEKLDLKFIKYEFRSDLSRNNNHRVTLLCPCGSQYEIAYYYLQRGKGRTCPLCVPKRNQHINPPLVIHKSHGPSSGGTNP